MPFKHYQATDTPLGKDVTGSDDFWAIRMLGAYEWNEDTDNDPDVEGSTTIYCGLTFPGNATAYVFDETTRDYLAFVGKTQQTVNLDTAIQLISAHEALHKFFGAHGSNPAADQGIMRNMKAVWTTADNALTWYQIKMIQRTRSLF